MAAYLQSQDYAAFGLPATTTPAQANAATRLIDGRIGKPDGLLWSPDAFGNPAWMTNKTATRSYVAATATTPGLNTITIKNANFGFGDIGACVLIDRAGTPESGIISEASGNTITVTTTQPHAAGATLEFGMAIAEDAPVRHGRVQTLASPLVAVLGVTGSYQGCRQGRSNYLDWVDQIVGTGLAGTIWNPFPPSQCDIDPTTGTCTLLPGTVRGGFSRVRLQYIAGWNYTNLPLAIKQACANLILAMMNSEMPTNIKMQKDGDAEQVSFNSSLFDTDTENLITSYRTIRL